MKTKKFFMLLAVVLLSGASAFAQSESETLKGDVNEDGVVDVADINAVIEIMKAGGGVVEPPTYYFSVGTTAPDASNYTTVNNATTDIPTTIEFTSSARVRHYFLIPNNKTLTVIDKVAQVAVPITENTSISIPNHKVYQTNGAIAATATVIITLSDVQPTYYWYAGQTQPTSISGTPTVDDTNFTNNKWHTLGDATTIAKTITGGTSGLDWYVAVPTEVGLKATAGDLSTPNTSWDNIDTITINSISYTVWRTNSKGGRQAVYMAK